MNNQPPRTNFQLHHWLLALATVLLTTASINVSAVLMQGTFQGQVTYLPAEGSNAQAALAALGVSVGDPVTVRIQYESSQTTDGYPDLTYYGRYNWIPPGSLNWMETTIGEHIWLSGPSSYLTALTTNDFEYKNSGVFIDALSFSAYDDFLLFPGATFDCGPFPGCQLSTSVRFEMVNAAPTLMISDVLPSSSFAFPLELARSEGDIWIENGGWWSVRYDIDLATAILAPIQVPAPSPLALIGLGLAGGLVFARRRKQ